MKVIVWGVRAIVFIVLLVLALDNTQTATLFVPPGNQWQAPLILIGLAFFAAGLLAGLLSALPYYVRMRFENGRFKRNLKTAREQSAPAEQPPLPPVM